MCSFHFLETKQRNNRRKLLDSPLKSNQGCELFLILFYFCLGRYDMPLGIEDGRVINQVMRASSYYNYYLAARNARLNQRRQGRKGAAWCAKRNNRAQWLQVDFGALTSVRRLATQGRQNADQWVTSYYLSYSKDGQRFFPYKQKRATKVIDTFCCTLSELQEPMVWMFLRYTLTNNWQLIGLFHFILFYINLFLEVPTVSHNERHTSRKTDLIFHSTEVFISINY